MGAQISDRSLNQIYRLLRCGIIAVFVIDPVTVEFIIKTFRIEATRSRLTIIPWIIIAQRPISAEPLHMHPALAR